MKAAIDGVSAQKSAVQVSVAQNAPIKKAKPDSDNSAASTKDTEAGLNANATSTPKETPSTPQTPKQPSLDLTA